LAGLEPLLSAPHRAESRLDLAAQTAQRFCAFLIMSVLLVIECVPFGLAFFPLSWTDLPVPRSLGIQMFLLSSAIAQATFAATSRFEAATGLMMCENIPFMKQIASSVHETLAEQGREEQALPTVLVCFALSTFGVGCAFYALGALRLGSVISLIPPYIILGCIGGIGVFIVQTGLEISTGLTFAWTADALLPFAHGAALARWSLSLSLSLCLRFLGRVVRSPLLTPAFFVLVPVGFHAALLCARVRYDAPELAGWFFEAEPTPDWRLLWTVYARGSVAWDVLPSQLGTFAALTLFSLAHIPINIPSLAMTTETVADVDVELRAHGVANILSALVGGVPNYVCYSNSALYHKCGGGGYAWSGALAVVQLVFFAIGPSAISVLPRCMAGALLLHMGLELVREAVVVPRGGLDRIEYTAVCLIATVMVFAGAGGRGGDRTEGRAQSGLSAARTRARAATRARARRAHSHPIHPRTARRHDGGPTGGRGPLPAHVCAAGEPRAARVQACDRTPPALVGVAVGGRAGVAQPAVERAALPRRAARLSLLRQLPPARGGAVRRARRRPARARRRPRERRRRRGGHADDRGGHGGADGARLGGGAGAR
jgi:MFS superfamily sulfate permease-like transporter